MNSEVEICSLGLFHVGAEPISDMNGTSKSARLCNLIYTQTRDDLLSKHFWNFAMTRISLALEVTAPAFGWGSSFILPADYLLMYETYPANIDYEIEDGKVLCNQATLSIKYVRKITDVTKFHPAFTESLGLSIGTKLAFPLAGSNTLAAALRDKFDESIKDAKCNDAISAPINEFIQDTFLESRRGGPAAYGRFNE